MVQNPGTGCGVQEGDDLSAGLNLVDQRLEQFQLHVRELRIKVVRISEVGHESLDM